MKVAIITPTLLLNKFAARSDYQFVLAHKFKEDAAYRAFYKARSTMGDRIIVDNGAYEFTTAVDADSLLKVASELDADICVLPDVRFQSELTLERTATAIKYLDELRPTTKLIGVPQGNDLESVIDAYTRLYDLGVDGFGLYEEIGEVTGLGNRAAFCQYLVDHDLVHPQMYYHMLGMEEDLTQLQDLAQFEWIDGIDSCKPIVYGMAGIALKPTGPTAAYPHRPKDYFDVQSVADEPLIQANISQTITWANTPRKSGISAT